MNKVTIKTEPITYNDFVKLIEFDNIHYINMMKKLGIPDQQLAPPLSLIELDDAYRRKDILEWIYSDGDFAGYFWFEKKLDGLYIAAIAILQNFHGRGLGQYILNLAESKAKENHLCLCRLSVIPLNGRALNAYFKQGYKITACAPAFFGAQYPDTFRLIMEKNLSASEAEKVVTDSVVISCSDYERLKNATDDGYVGVRLIRAENNNNFENKIYFERLSL